MDDRSLLGLRALVTKGTRGIGRATADRLAAGGARVVVSARTEPADCEHAVVTADLAVRGDVEAMARHVLAGIDVVVSNVGGQIRRPTALDLDDDDWDQELALNLLSAVRLDRVLAPRLVAQGAGAIVHVSSSAAHMARPSSLAYSAAKAALNVYSKGLATELGPHGVRVNVVSPGLIHSDRTAEVAAERGMSLEEMLAATVAQMGVPLGRPGEVDEAAELIAFLVSHAASYLTGTQFTIDGGAFPTV